jgi:CRP/FNR family transcriptional regulator
MALLAQTPSPRPPAQLNVWHQVYKRGEALFRVGEPFRSIGILRSGAVKTFLQRDDGSEQVLDFLLPGDILGLDAIAAGQYMRNAVALDTTSACLVPYEGVDEISSHFPALRREMMRQMSLGLVRDARVHMLLTMRTADQRLAAFLLDLSRWYRAHGFSAREFQLPMPRADIANYLNIKPETLSRALTRMQNDGLIHVERRRLLILDPEALRATAGETIRPETWQSAREQVQ